MIQGLNMFSIRFSTRNMVGWLRSKCHKHPTSGERDDCQTTWRGILPDSTGGAVIEFAAVASLIAIAALSAFVGLGGEVRGKYEAVETSWEMGAQ